MLTVSEGKVRRVTVSEDKISGLAVSEGRINAPSQLQGGIPKPNFVGIDHSDSSRQSVNTKREVRI